jgi:HAD superfamily hydrolase (TIGR01450 family)
MISETYDGFVCDLDGVVYRGSAPIPGAAEAIARSRASGHRFLFCTNNSYRTPGSYIERLGAQGIQASREEVLTSAMVTARVLRGRAPENRAVYLVGGPGIRGELEGAGFDVVSPTEDRDVGTVVVGADPDFTYDAMRRAARAVREGALLIGTNPDTSFPATDGLWPGAGAILASIEVASGVQAEIMGKPRRPMMEEAARRLEGCKSIAAIGDLPATDLDGARSQGWGTILVLSGVTDTAAVAGLDPQPDHVIGSIAELA